MKTPKSDAGPHAKTNLTAYLVRFPVPGNTVNLLG